MSCVMYNLRSAVVLLSVAMMHFCGLTAMRFQYDSIAHSVVYLLYSSSVNISSSCYVIYIADSRL